MHYTVCFSIYWYFWWWSAQPGLPCSFLVSRPGVFNILPNYVSLSLPCLCTLLDIILKTVCLPSFPPHPIHSFLKLMTVWRIRGKNCHHRLNGSSSSVLTATSLSYGKAKNSTRHRIKTPDPIKMKFGTVDYVGEGTRPAKFYANPPKGGFPANGWNIRTNFYSYPYTFFFRNSPTGQTLRRIFACNGSNDAVSRQDVPFGG